LAKIRVAGQEKGLAKIRITARDRPREGYARDTPGIRQEKAKISPRIGHE
jgi:hypothetical protein